MCPVQCQCQESPSYTTAINTPVLPCLIACCYSISIATVLVYFDRSLIFLLFLFSLLTLLLLFYLHSNGSCLLRPFSHLSPFPLQSPDSLFLPLCSHLFVWFLNKFLISVTICSLIFFICPH